MFVELVSVTTEDGLRLDGALQSATPGMPSDLGADAFLCLHGTGGNFYGSSLFKLLAPRLVAAGASVLCVNTRGHDGVSTASLGKQRVVQGSAFELVDDCRFDVPAWIEFLVARGAERIGVLGHSLGAVKALYSQAVVPHARTRLLIAVSPPRLSHAWFLASSQAEEFRADLELARQHVTAGQPDRLLEVRFPLPYLVSARGFVDKYGPAERYNVLNFATRLNCPTLFTFGTLELAQGVAFRGLPEALMELAKSNARLQTAIIAGADHLYQGVQTDLFARLESWLRRTAISTP